MKREQKDPGRKLQRRMVYVEDAKKTISFGTNDGSSKAAAPSKPALKKGEKEKSRRTNMN